MRQVKNVNTLTAIIKRAEKAASFLKAASKLIKDSNLSKEESVELVSGLNTSIDKITVTLDKTDKIKKLYDGKYNFRKSCLVTIPEKGCIVPENSEIPEKIENQLILEETREKVMLPENPYKKTKNPEIFYTHEEM